MQAQYIYTQRIPTQVYFDGGTPTYLSNKQLTEGSLVELTKEILSFVTSQLFDNYINNITQRVRFSYR